MVAGSGARPQVYRPFIEELEPRLVPYALSGYQWASANISASFVPDGTALAAGVSSNLYARFNAEFPAAVWQRELARALQTWATVTPLNFRLIADDGSTTGSSGSSQGDPRFGDIRFGAYSSTGSFLAFASYPTAASTKGGDVVLNSSQSFHIGSTFDLYSVVLHEVGHALGLSHSDVAGAVMRGAVKGVYAGLSADDIAGIQAIYGPRRPDAFDTGTPNNSFQTARALGVNQYGMASVRADLTTIVDVDYFRVRVPASSTGRLYATLDARNLSLLSPKLTISNAALRRLATASAAGRFGTVVSLNLKLIPGRTYFITADGASADVFGMGNYRLDLRFGGFPAPPPTTSTSTSTGGTTTSGDAPSAAAMSADAAVPTGSALSVILAQLPIDQKPGLAHLQDRTPAEPERPFAPDQTLAMPLSQAESAVPPSAHVSITDELWQALGIPDGNSAW